MYRGRFAPSPTGPLHLGSLFTALASFLDARAAGGRWLLRIEDLDPPRESPGSAARILASLHAHALRPDEPVLFQGSRAAAYDAAIAQLIAQGDAFYCTCSRQELAGGTHAPACPRSAAPPDRPAAIRVATVGCEHLDDRLLGARALQPEGDSFVIRRKDGLYAYHLAVVVDDAFQRVSHVVRGRDLLESTAAHLRLQRLLGLPHPSYAHLPLLLNAEGQKLSKQNLAPALDDTRAPDNLRLCLRGLGQPEPPPRCRDCDALLEWAIPRWDPARIPGTDLPANRTGEVRPPFVAWRPPPR